MPKRKPSPKTRRKPSSSKKLRKSPPIRRRLKAMPDVLPKGSPKPRKRKPSGVPKLGRKPHKRSKPKIYKPRKRAPFQQYKYFYKDRNGHFAKPTRGRKLHLYVCSQLTPKHKIRCEHRGYKVWHKADLVSFRTDVQEMIKVAPMTGWKCMKFPWIKKGKLVFTLLHEIIPKIKFPKKSVHVHMKIKGEIMYPTETQGNQFHPVPEFGVMFSRLMDAWDIAKAIHNKFFEYLGYPQFSREKDKFKRVKQTPKGGELVGTMNYTITKFCYLFI